jgi:hypothetical protein
MIAESTAADSRREGPPLVPARDRSWAEYCLVPGLVIAMVVGNQEWRVGPFLAGQMLSWITDLAAFIVLLRFFPTRVWPWILVAAIVLAKLLDTVGLGAGAFDTAYTVLLNALFCAAGSVFAYRHSALALRQLRWICLTSVVVMIFQATGAGEWSQVLATENEGRPKTAYPTLFVPFEQLEYQTIQARPSGLLHSNNFLSLVVLFTLALQHSRKTIRRLNRWDVVLGIMVVLAMAKIVFLVSAIFIVWLLVMGTPAQRARMRALVVLYVALFATYRFFMPGQFESQINTYHITYSFYIRINDFLDRLDYDNPLVTILSPYLVNTPRLDRDAGDTGFSGYAQALKVVPVIVVASLLLVPIFRRALRRLKRRVSNLSSVPVLTAIVALIYPGAVPFFAAQIYWFVAGFACLPLLILALRSRRPRRRVPEWTSGSTAHTQTAIADGGPPS